MTNPKNAAAVLTQAHNHWGLAKSSMEKAALLEKWVKGEQLAVKEYAGEVNWSGAPYKPKQVTSEYDDLMERTPSAWGGLLVRSMSQTAYIEGVRRGGSQDNLGAWKAWKRNGMDAKQIPLHQGALGQGESFVCVEEATDPLTGATYPRISAYSAKRMTAFFTEERDDWPGFAIWASRREDFTPPPGSTKQQQIGVWDVFLVDEVGYHYLTCKHEGDRRDDWTYIELRKHKFTVPPVVRYVGELNLEGDANGIVEPVIPLLRRIDQDTFDRLIVQRFGAWKVRWATGMAEPKGLQEAYELRIQDFLGSENKDTRFGVLQETEIRGFLEAGQNDLRELSALGQIPPHHLLGLSDNLQAEALAAAEAGLQRRSLDFRTINGESHERLFRLLAISVGNVEEARADDIEVQWRDTESRSMTQAVQALGMAAQQLGVPVQLLWEKIPNWSDTDQKRALELIESGAADAMIAAAQEAALAAKASGASNPSATDTGEARRNAAGQ